MENEAEFVSRRMMAQFVIEYKVNHEDEISQVEWLYSLIVRR